MSELSLNIPALHAAYAGGAQPADVVRQCFRRLAEVNDPGIFISLLSVEDVVAAAQQLPTFDTAAYPLWGVPFAVKDNIDVAGLPTTAACPDYAYVPEADATVVAHIRAAGGLLVGKTNLDQFATGLVGVRTPYPAPRNSIDPELVPGGSSAGSAVATSHGIVSFALGTDTAGSGRIPAGLNNIVGLKPSLGALSTTGVVPACRTLDCVSIFALTAEDAWRAFEVVAKYDPADPYSRQRGSGRFGVRPPRLKVGVPALADRRFDHMTLQTAYEATLARLGKLDCDIVEIPFEKFYDVADLLYGGAWVAERFAAIEEFVGTNEASLHPITASIILGARNLSASDAFKGLYALQSAKTELAHYIDSVDLICVPTAPANFTVEEVSADPINTNNRLGTYTNFVNLLNMCGIAVPVPSDTQDYPASITLLARAGNDALLASVASELHAASGLSLGATKQPVPKTIAAPDQKAEGIELVVVGAHLSGMPLNHELLDHGAEFMRAVRTCPDYRLFALSGDQTPKPGLLRTQANEGNSIEAEVWCLAPHQFGTFVASVPAPLSIGTVKLEDASEAKGFLVEALAVEGARDISDFGSWRNYVRAKDTT